MSSKAAALAAWDQASGSFFDDVVEWHQSVGHPVRAHVEDLDVDSEDELGWRLIKEEHKELLSAGQRGNKTGVADGIADLVWVLYSLAARLGINMNAVWSEVRRANFEKTGATRRADGKILKPEGWRPPDIKAALKVPIPDR
jgi:predicted HAD superfamily Cof-like phosphohydrolase